MNHYPSKEMSVRELLRQSVRLHYLTLKHTIQCILAIAIIKYIPIILGLFITNIFFTCLFYFVATSAILYFFAVALLTTHRVFLDKVQTLAVSANTLWKNKWPIFAVFWSYIAGSFVLYYVIYFIALAISKLSHNPSFSPNQGMTLFIMLCLMMTYISMCYFSFPLMILDNKKKFLAAFHDSLLLTEKNKVGVLFLLTVLFFTIILLTPGMVHEYLLSTYHLDIVFDFVVLCVAVPLYINFLLLLINDSKQQL